MFWITRKKETTRQNCLETVVKICYDEAQT